MGINGEISKFDRSSRLLPSSFEAKGIHLIVGALFALFIILWLCSGDDILFLLLRLTD